MQDPSGGAQPQAKPWQAVSRAISSRTRVRATRSTSRFAAIAAPPAARSEEGLLALTEMLGDGVARDVVATLAASITSFLWVKMFGWLASNDVLERKLSRKLVHVSSGPLFMLFSWPLFSSTPKVGECSIRHKLGVRSESQG